MSFAVRAAEHDSVRLEGLVSHQTVILGRDSDAA
jgi:hypothetical protein